jgi:hypothetical protein
MLVNAPLSIETAKELREWSEEISGRVMNDLLHERSPQGRARA